jgi:hypothetical protein
MSTSSPSTSADGAPIRSCLPVTIPASFPSTRRISEIAHGFHPPGSPSHFAQFVTFALSAAGSKVDTECRAPSGKEVKPIKSGNEIHEQS